MSNYGWKIVDITTHVLFLPQPPPHHAFPLQPVALLCKFSFTMFLFSFWDVLSTIVPWIEFQDKNQRKVYTWWLYPCFMLRLNTARMYSNPKQDDWSQSIWRIHSFFLHRRRKKKDIPCTQYRCDNQSSWWSNNITCYLWSKYWSNLLKHTWRKKKNGSSQMERTLITTIRASYLINTHYGGAIDGAFLIFKPDSSLGSEQNQHEKIFAN